MTGTASLPVPQTLSMRTAEFVVMIASLMSLNALAIDIMLPAMDDIAAALGIGGGVDAASDNRQQWIVYSYIAGFGIPQLVFGPLSDYFGRKSLLLGALAAYSAIALLCMFATSFYFLLAIRFVQGVTAGAIRVIAVSIVRDVYAGRGMARIMSLVMTVFMIVPILAPSIGQLIMLVAPWQWTFGVLGVAGIILFLWCSFRLVETLPADASRVLSFKTAGHAYIEVLKSRVTFGYMLASGVIFGSLFAFIGSAEQIFSEVFDREATFALWFAAIAGTMSVASFTNSRLVERFGMRRISHAALIAFTAFSLLLLISMMVFGEKFSLFFPLFALVFGCFGLIGSNFNALAMEPLGEIAGTASAAYGFATTTMSACIGFLIGAQFNGSVVPVITGFAMLGVGSLIVVTITEKGNLLGLRDA